MAFAVLGATFLTVTGAEAMYADMGHFGRLPIRVGWFAIVSPALMLNYFGQGGLLLANPDAIENPFYLLAPKWAALSDGGVRNHRHRDRLASDNLRRVPPHPAGDATGLPPTHAGASRFAK